MTFGEKMQLLRKKSGMSQEELAHQLGVSRQAVSKWETDNGYPETEKIIRMGKLFHVTLDYLLNEENRSDARDEEPGVYISQEMAKGFLDHQRNRYLRISAVAAIWCWGFGAVLLPFAMVTPLFTLLLIGGGILLLYVWMAERPYSKIWKEPLLLDQTVQQDLRETYLQQKKRLSPVRWLGGILIGLGLLFFPLLSSEIQLFGDTAMLAAGMAVTGVGLFPLIYITGILRAYRLLMGESPHSTKGNTK